MKRSVLMVAVVLVAAGAFAETDPSFREWWNLFRTGRKQADVVLVKDRLQVPVITNPVGAVSIGGPDGVVIQGGLSATPAPATVTPDALVLASGKVIVGGASGTGSAVTVSGDMTLSSTGVAAIQNKSIDSANVSLASGKVIIGGASATGAAQTVSGDITLSSSGVAAIQNKSVDPANISLASGKVIIGGGSATGAAQTVSGDATLSNAGVLALANKSVQADDVELADGYMLVGGSSGTGTAVSVTMSSMVTMPSWAGATAVRDFLWVAPRACTLDAVYVLSDTATTGSGNGTNWTWSVSNVSDGVVIGVSTNTEGSEVVANRPYLVTGTDATLSVDDVVVLITSSNKVPKALNTAEVKAVVKWIPR